MRRMQVRRLAAVGLTVLCATLALSGAAAAGVSYTVVTQLPFNTGLSSCTGELVAVQGTMLVKDHVTVNGDRTHNEYTDHITDADALGTVSGARYVLTDTTTESFNESSDQTPTEFTSEHSMTLTRLGEDGSLVNGDDLFVHLIAHGTVNANGTATADTFETRSECR